MDAKVTVFDHVDKSGGSTFKGMLRQEFKDRYIEMGEYHSFCKVPTSLSGEWCFAGHFAVGGLYQLDRFPDHHILTFLRDPLSRFTSLYNYVRRTYYSKADMVSFLLTEYFNNTYVYWFGQGDLDRAKATLSQPHISFGLTKYFDASIGYFNQRIGRNLALSSRKNVNTLHMEKLPEEFIEQFDRFNREDQELYAWAERFFLERTAHDVRQASAAQQQAGVGSALRDICSDVWDADLEAQRQNAAAKRQSSGDWWTIYRFEAQTLRRLNKMDEAQARLLEGNRKFPGLLLFDLFEFYLDQGLEEQSQDCLRQIGSNIPKPPFEVNLVLQQHYCRYIMCVYQWDKKFGNKTSALERLRIGVQNLKWFTESLLKTYCMALIECADANGAIMFLGASENNYDDKKKALVYLLKAEAYFSLDDQENVVKYALKAVEVDGLSPDIVIKSCALLANCGHRKESISLLESAARRLRHAWIGKPVAVALARCLLDDQDAARAVAALRELPFDLETDYNLHNPALELDICTLLLRAGATGVARERHLKRLTQADKLEQLDIVLCRKLDLHRHAIDHLRARLPGETGEGLRLYAKELAVSLFEDGQEAEANKILAQVFPPSRLPDLKRLFAGAQRICIIRACPWVFCNYVCDALPPLLRQAFGLVTTQPDIARKLGFESIFAMPGGTFDYVRDKGAIAPPLGAKAFTVCLLLGSTADPGHYAALARLACEIAERAFFYSFDQLLGAMPQGEAVALAQAGHAEASAASAGPLAGNGAKAGHV
ncbi:hypothetical protein [Solidesulfovibrio sp.]|uniref:hypothetical protein n=1 Tax=Solidesulfovibrio sp. TaxID=2910990 RepID=UPI002627A56C|nr:hypothetical protein [Solidesulfovibrio sp.]